MKLSYIILTLFVASGSMAHAALGGEIAAMETESKALNVKPTLSPSTRYTTYEFAQHKVTIHQFASANGKIFAVAWKGQTHPNLAALMGTHYSDFQKALAQAKKNYHGRAPVEIEVDGFHLEMGGHAMSVYGRAWLINQLPPQVDTRELQ
jgi:hypothetical protein